MEQTMRLETLAVHAGGEADALTGAVAPPIHLSTTFEHGPASEETHGYLYIREGNPTQDRLEKALALLEGGEAALVFSSGMGAAAAIVQSLEPDSHMIIPDDLYVHVRVLAEQYAPKWNIQSTVVDMTSPAAVEAAIQPNTGLIWAETPSNPKLRITDVRAIAQVAREAGALLVVDNTFATPVLQRPLSLGADIVLHSTTKYCGGHSDVQGGCLILGSAAALYQRLLHARTVLGAVGSPFNSWLVLRGLRTLPLRMERHSANALHVARALADSVRVERVFYPGLPSHPGHETATRQMRAFGGIVSFLVEGGWPEAVAVASRVKLFQTATSLGGVESLIEHRASSEGKSSKSPPNLLRLSVGLEHPEDLIADLLWALAI